MITRNNKIFKRVIFSKSKHIKKYLLSISIIILGIVLFITNYKYPYFYNVSGPWEIGYDKMPANKIQLNINQKNIISSKNIISDTNSVFIADPFFIYKNDTIFLFVENQIKNDGANIDLFIIADSSIDHKGTILDMETHISYPQVFFYNNDYYMLPETKRSNNLLLYKSDSFPYKWSISDTLMKNIRVKDPTIMIGENHHVIFTCNDDLELIMYCSDTIFSGWEECENYTKYFGNEVRPAGRIFKVNDKIFIPMQNLKLGYGTSVSLFEIIIKDNSIKLIKEMSGFLAPQLGSQHFNSSMHHIDIQEHNGSYIYFYDGRSLIDKSFSFKRSLKYNYLDLKSMIYNIIF